MKEIDTEAPVVWPAWCYSGNIATDVLKQVSSNRDEGNFSSSSSSPLSSYSTEITASGTSPCKSIAALVLTPDLTTDPVTVDVKKKLRIKRKIYPTKITEAVDGKAGIGQNKISQKKKKEPKKSSPILALDQKEICPTKQLKCNAEQALYTEKMLSDRILLSGYNAVESGKQLYSNSSAYLFLEKVKNETQMESLKDSESANKNNVNNSNNNSTPSNSNNNNNNTNSNNNNIISNNNNPSGNCITNNTNSVINSVISNNNSNSNSNTSNNSVKRERLSPGTNGDAQFSLSRSRSATPSSFRGTPPQTTHPNNDIQLHNLSTNLLNQIQNRSSDFSTRNYSDFMRSLAAKYNNSNPNDSGTSRRNTFFENSKISQSVKSSTNNNSNNGSNLKEQASPSDSVKSSQNIQNLTANTSSVPPFVQTFLSSLPFSPGVFPPLIDMSSTQALVTLARAAKEAEIKNILMSAQKRSSLSNSTASSSPGTNLTAALHQAAQFASPALLYSAQLQQQQQQQQQQKQQSQIRQSSPNQETSTNSPGEKNMTASPLDLSAAPPAKRFKAESISSASLDRSPNPESAPENASTSTSGATIRTPSSSPKVKSTSTAITSEVPALTATISTTPVLPLRQCQAQSDEVNAWTVEDVCSFVGSIDICAIYVKNFREQCIDGSGLPLLTEDHLINQLGMKLGPALKLRTMFAKKLGGPCPCVSCSSQAQLLAAAQAAAVTVATPSSGITGKNQLHPQQFNAGNSAPCNSSISQTTTTVTTLELGRSQRKNSLCGSAEPSSAESGS